jgi:hypothetical protein
VAWSAEEIVGGAVERVLTRYGVVKAGGGDVSADEFLRDVLAEAVTQVNELVARDLRRMQRAAERIRAAEDLIVAMTLAAAPVVVAPPAADRLRAVAADLGGLPGAGVPRWHPEHPLNLGNDSQEE